MNDDQLGPKISEVIQEHYGQERNFCIFIFEPGAVQPDVVASQHPNKMAAGIVQSFEEITGDGYGEIQAPTRKQKKFTA